MKLRIDRRLFGRLFYCLMMLLVGIAARATGPQTTAIHDVVYRADGTPASGTVLISWSAFTTADEQAVAAGSLSVSLGDGGAFDVALAPNVHATPAGTYYGVVFKLDDGTTSTERWAVPAVPQTTISAVRSTLMPANVAVQVASRQYVDTGLALKANDASVVHLGGSETIVGVKTFSAAPAVPTPSSPSDAVNKAYVDDTVSGQGNSYAPASAHFVTTQAEASLSNETVYDWATVPNKPALAATRTCSGTDKVSGYDAATGSFTCSADQSSSGAPTTASYITANPEAALSNETVYGWATLPGKPFLNVKTDCPGVAGDGTTDDAAAVNACFTAHPGAHFYFPKTQAAGSNDYYFGAPLLLKGSGITIEGSGPATLQAKGATTFQFASGVTGIQCDIANTGKALIESLELYGTVGNVAFWLPSWYPILPKNHGGNATASDADGLRLGCGSVEVRDVLISGFARHGVNVNSGAVGSSDQWANGNVADLVELDRVTAYDNGGCGFWFEGADSQVGTLVNANAAANQLCGFYDSTGYGNTYVTPHTAYNHTDNTSAGAGVSITGISVASNVATVTLATSQTWKAGNWLVLAGVTNPAFNGTHVLQSKISGTQYTFNLTLADTSSSGGTARLATNTEGWTAAGVSTCGAYCMTNTGIALTTLIHPYQEGNQCSALSVNNVNIEGGWAADSTPCPGSTMPPQRYGGIWSVPQGQMTFVGSSATGMTFALQGASGANAASGFSMSNAAGTVHWRIAEDWAGFVGLNTWEGLQGSSTLRQALVAGGNSYYNASGSGAVYLNGGADVYNHPPGTGGTKFGSGGPSPAVVASVDNTGKATFNGGLVLGDLIGCSNGTTDKLLLDGNKKIVCGTDQAGGSGGVTSFNSRTGAVMPAANDYSWSDLASKPALALNRTCTGTDKLSAYDSATGQFTCTPDQTGGAGSPYASGGATVNVIPKSNGASQLADSSLVDNGVSISTTEPLTIAAGTICTAPGLNFSGSTNYGMAQSAGSATTDLCANGNDILAAGNGSVRFQATAQVGWPPSGGAASAGADTAIKRQAAHVVGIVNSYASAVNVVTSSGGTAAFDAELGNTQQITLTESTSASITHLVAGEPLNFLICQNGSGGFTFAWPAEIKGGMAVGTAANTCSAQSFIVNAAGTTAYATSSGVINQ